MRSLARRTISPRLGSRGRGSSLTRMVSTTTVPSRRFRRLVCLPLQHRANRTLPLTIPAMALLGRILDIECQRIGLFDDGNIVRPDSDGDAVAAIVEQIARNMANRTKHPKRRCFLTPIRI